jgi:hypothetical protein
MQFKQIEGRPPILGTFVQVDFGELKIEWEEGFDEADRAKTAFFSSVPDEVWVSILVPIMQASSADVPQLPTKEHARAQYSGLHPRVAGQNVRVVDFVPSDDFQCTRTLYSAKDDLSASVRSVRTGQAIPEHNNENYIHDFSRHNAALVLPDDEDVLKETVIGKRYDTLNLIESFRQLSRLSLVCKAFHQIVKHAVPRIEHFKSCKDYYTLKENETRFWAAVLMDKRPLRTPPPVLDTIWKESTNYTKLALVRKRLHSHCDGNATFVMEVLPIWLMKDKISGFNVKLFVTQRANSTANPFELHRRASYVEGASSAGRRAIPCPINNATAKNRIELNQSHNTALTHDAGRSYVRNSDRDVTRSIVSGMHFFDKSYLSSIAWYTSVPSLTNVLEAPDASAPPAEPSAKKKRGRASLKQRYVNLLLPQRIEIEIFFNKERKKSQTIQARPFYSLVRHPTQRREFCGLEPGEGA